MGRKARDSSASESESDRRAKDKKRGRDDRKKERRSRSRGRSKERKRSPEKKAAPKRGRSASEESDASKSSDDEEEMKEFLLSTDMPEDQMLSKMMGFSAFDSSKGKDHGSSDLSDVKRATKRQYRQYMNRRGGFNRPLDAAF
eukprot:CAMPEP_0197623210 /NCGR_PEP_ID=MMETSP1338-20131121/3267_1 /TAXON_ID=43686 ORGANISM="Pelagodinium beii, Strain RCC1491" /NCGR_SAMPLE_ID=MMETSP1338 /ASSEMBLY_ACC=CAM_ASM_000754 /LENGTH=142 /DNA_ID=CAMNT_0043193109 /DNA_START=53 /DNA_END=481 /DNA_ORIENTATION=+